LILSIILIHSCKKKEEVPVLRPTKTIGISTTSVTSITQITARSGGDINTNSLTGISVTARGVCWSTSANPTITLATKTSDGGGYGHFSSSITGLTPNTTYFVRAYATNNISSGTIYGNEEVFTTTSTTNGIVLSTTGITAITGTTAISGGYITSYGGTLVTARGVCWSTSANPTITLATKTSDGTGLGEFSSSITGLLTNSTYYVRAYATNSIGTAYGNEWILKTYTGTVTDIDLNVYNTVTIGSQVWMAENLKTTKYNDGTAIPNVTVDAEWGALITGAYSDYGNNPANSNTYGRLYNWYAVDNNASTEVASNGGKNVCPTNWHVPTDAEWTTLTTYLGGDSVAGGKLKETDTTHWLSPNTGATNESGFTALPGDARDHDGSYYKVGLSGYWWSSEETFTTNAWSRFLYYDYTYVSRYDSGKRYGFSVRCIKDN
jgi:uncharacterized protein (TIGR02145 family)